MIHLRAIALLALALVAACSARQRRDSVASVPSGAPLVVRDMEGAVHDLDRTLAGGKLVVLVFWQTWCASCRGEAPALAAAARAHADDFAFYGVVPGPDERVDDAEVRRVAGELGLSYPQVRDRDLALTRRFAVEGTPTILVLEEGGGLVYRGHQAPPDWDVLSAR